MRPRIRFLAVFKFGFQHDVVARKRVCSVEIGHLRCNFVENGIDGKVVVLSFHHFAVLVGVRWSCLILVVACQSGRGFAERQPEPCRFGWICNVYLERTRKQVACCNGRIDHLSEAASAYCLQLGALAHDSAICLTGRIFLGFCVLVGYQEACVSAAPVHRVFRCRQLVEYVEETAFLLVVPLSFGFVPPHVLEVVFGSHVVADERHLVLFLPLPILRRNGVGLGRQEVAHGSADRLDGGSRRKFELWCQVGEVVAAIDKELHFVVRNQRFAYQQTFAARLCCHDVGFLVGCFVLDARCKRQHEQQAKHVLQQYFHVFHILIRKIFCVQSYKKIFKKIVFYTFLDYSPQNDEHAQIYQK